MDRGKIFRENFSLSTYENIKADKEWVQPAFFIGKNLEDRVKNPKIRESFTGLTY